MIAYDIETKYSPDDGDQYSWDDPKGMGFGIAVAYDFGEDRYRFYGPDEAPKLIDLLKWDGTALTFNGNQFDNKVLLGNSYDKQWEDEDLLQQVVASKFKTRTMTEAVRTKGRSKVHNGTLNLDSLAKGTLDAKKIGHGALAPQLLREKRWAYLFAYCLHDVRLTVQLWKFKEQHGFLVDKTGYIIRFPEHLRGTAATSRRRGSVPSR